MALKLALSFVTATMSQLERLGFLHATRLGKCFGTYADLFLFKRMRRWTLEKPSFRCVAQAFEEVKRGGALVSAGFASDGRIVLRQKKKKNMWRFGTKHIESHSLCAQTNLQIVTHALCTGEGFEAGIWNGNGSL